jgi:glycosyltransferase involved in cell wall biosynthesis
VNLSVIIPCYNAADTLGGQLEALANQYWSQSWEVIVVDNRSTDDSRQIAERYKARLPNLRIVDASARQGQPFALNIGVEAATSEAVAFCDADDEVAPGWVAAMGEALSRHDFVACSIDSEKLNPPWVVVTRGHPQRDGLQKISYPPYLLHAGGGTLGVKRSLHAMVGGFDESLPYLHDTDFCFKLQLAGVQLHFVPDAVMHVRFRHTLRGAYNQARCWAEYTVKVYKKYKEATGTELPPSWKRYMKNWQYLLWQLPFMRQKKDCYHFLWMLGRQVGLLQGSLKYRIAPPVRS